MGLKAMAEHLAAGSGRGGNPLSPAEWSEIADSKRMHAECSTASTVFLKHGPKLRTVDP
jgi:hypothetical protein